MGYPEHNNFGEKVPQISRHFESDLTSPLLPISNMPEGTSGLVELIALSGYDIKTLENQQISIGVRITKTPTSTNVSGSPFLFSEDLEKRILVRLED